MASSSGETPAQAWRAQPGRGTQLPDLLKQTSHCPARAISHKLRTPVAGTNLQFIHHHMRC